MEALQMLKFHFKKSRLNFMSEWQSVIVADDEEDWLRVIASTGDDEHKKVIRRRFQTAATSQRFQTLKCRRTMGIEFDLVLP
jgi:hypothetical protein